MDVYISGNLLREEEAKISVRERAFLFGDGVYTELLVRDGLPFFLKENIRRLRAQAEAVSIVSDPISEEQVRHFIDLNGARKGSYSLKMVLTSGMGADRELLNRKGSLVMLLTPLASHPQEKIKLTTYPEGVRFVLPKIKSLSYLPRLYLKEYAVEHRADELILFDPAGHILETAFSNLFWTHKKLLFYPDEALDYLPGIALKLFIERAKKLGYEAHPGKYKESHLQNCHLYLVSQIGGVKPVDYLKDYSLDKDEREMRLFIKEFEQLRIEKSS